MAGASGDAADAGGRGDHALVRLRVLARGLGLGETSNTPWNPKLWVPYLALPLGFGLYALQLAADTWAMLGAVEEPFGLDPDAGLTDAVAESAD